MFNAYYFKAYEQPSFFNRSVSSIQVLQETKATEAKTYILLFFDFGFLTTAIHKALIIEELYT